MVSPDCLSAEALGAYAAGTLADMDVETIDAHLRACDDCVARLDELAARPDPLRVVLLAGVFRPPRLAVLAAHTLYWTDLRISAPVIPRIALIAAVAWDRPRPIGPG